MLLHALYHTIQVQRLRIKKIKKIFKKKKGEKGEKKKKKKKQFFWGEKIFCIQAKFFLDCTEKFFPSIMFFFFPFFMCLDPA